MATPIALRTDFEGLQLRKLDASKNRWWNRH
jgi:hypothetical protein